MNQLGDEWAIRAYAIPADHNSFAFEDLTDPNGALGSIEKAQINQRAPIFFLGGTFVADAEVTGGGDPTYTPERSIVVPPGAVLLFPLINAISPDPSLNPPVPANEAGDREIVHSFFDAPAVFTATVTVDGSSISTIGPVSSGQNTAFRRESPQGGFSYRIPQDSILEQVLGMDFRPQTIPIAVSDGYWYAYDTRFLGPGSHTINFAASIDIDADGAADFTLDVTYNLLNPIAGTNQNDNRVGTSSNDYMTGGNGQDILTGNAGDDVIIGGNGKDSLTGSPGDDELWGGMVRIRSSIKQVMGVIPFLTFNVGLIGLISLP